MDNLNALFIEVNITADLCYWQMLLKNHALSCECFLSIHRCYKHISRRSVLAYPIAFHSALTHCKHCQRIEGGSCDWSVTWATRVILVSVLAFPNTLILRYCTVHAVTNRRQLGNWAVSADSTLSLYWPYPIGRNSS